MSHLPSFAMLRAFEAAARLKSLRKAALELHIDHTVVSRHVANLQKDLGVQLIFTSSKGITLTSLGEEYAEALRVSLADLKRATEQVRRKSNAITLNISCTPGLATRFLATRISQFTSHRPKLSVTLQPNDQMPDLSTGEVDLDIRQVAKAPQNYQSEILCNPRIFPVASPAWLSEHPNLKSPRDLISAPLVHEDRALYWRLWLSAAGVEPPEQLQGLRVWQAHLAIEAAIGSEGIALANELIIGSDLEKGRLMEPFPSDLTLMPYLLIARRDRWKEPMIMQFRKWLSATIREHLNG